MRESSFTLFFLPIFIFAFFPTTFWHLITFPVVAVSSLLGSLGATLLPTKFSSRDGHHIHIDPIANAIMSNMSWFQKTLTLPSRSRGSYLITSEIESQLPEISQYRVGIVHLFLQHTSAALSLNENWDGDVRKDMSDALDRIVPEDTKGDLYRHAAEGPDDMPAHVKSALIGASVTVPITNGRLNTGTWQGIWFLEFRRAKHSRKVLATIQGEKI